MKFQCDRCKTRYSIADERVRGKILKIRCKNCSAVITVREDMGVSPAAASATKGAASRAASAPNPMDRTLAGTAAPSRSASTNLKGVGAAAAAKARQQRTANPFTAKTVEKSSASLASAVQQAAAKQPPPVPAGEPPPPDTLEEEWYVSVDGSQVGPFSMSEAKDWIADRDPNDELHCWNEDFDDWLPIEKVSHFRGLRRDRLASLGIGSQEPGADRSETEQSSLPAPSMDEGATEESNRAPSFSTPFEGDAGASNPHQPFASLDAMRKQEPEAPAAPMATANRAGEPPTLGAGDDLDLDIGEASRIVKLPMLMRGMGAAGVAGKVDDEDDDDDPGDALLAGPAPAAKAKALPGVARIGRGTGPGPAITRAQTEAPVLAPLSDSAMASASPDILHATPGNAKRSWLIIGILAALIPGIIIFFVIARDSGDDEDDTSRTRTSYSGLGGGGGGKNRNSKFGVSTDEGPDAGTKKRRWPRNNGTNGSKRKRADAGTKSAANGNNADLRPLTPNDVTSAARAGRIGTSRCYMRAQRKDFNISQIKRIRFFIKVDKNGAVIQVNAREHGDTYLAKCMRGKIRKWKFRKASKGIATETSIVFGN